MHPYFPEFLITTEGVEQVLNDPGFKFIEVDLDPDAYDFGHLEGAVKWDWEQQLRDSRTQEIITPRQMATLLSESGIEPQDTIVLYGDNNNWFACWAFWLLYMMGHEKIQLMDGGIKKWLSEEKTVSIEPVTVDRTEYPVSHFDTTNKATTEQVVEAFFSADTHRLIDVRSESEFEGLETAPAGVPSRCSAAGRIPTAVNIPWNMNCNSDGTFKSADELRALYSSFDVNAENTIITYCAIGERASLSWFVLKLLLGRNTVMNYDRGLALWSQLENAPLVRRKAS